MGAGITGITLAWTLAEQGATVALLEAGRIAGEASGRNAGFLLAIFLVFVTSLNAVTTATSSESAT